jgi:hypothetical protein
MASTIEIIVKGIAICYKKTIADGRTVWRVLFPFNDCHSVKLSCDMGGETIFLGHLGSSKSKIEIVTGSTTSSTGSTTDFKEVLDLTSDGSDPAHPLVTHASLQKKSGWDERGVALTIPNMYFDVRNSLRDFAEIGNSEIYLEDTEGGIEQPIEDIAHSVRGTIDLSGGETASIIIDGRTIFTSQPEVSCVLVFDNDCKEEHPDHPNDMVMIYQLVEEPGNEDRMFLVKGRAKADGDKNLMSEPPNLLGGKPCLVVKVSKSDDLP